VIRDQGSGMKRVGIIIVLAALAILRSEGAGQTGPPPAAAQSGGNVENGKKLYTAQTCYYCHGTVGQGAVTGARLAPPARNVAAFIRYIRRPSGQMPAFSETMLSDQALTDIYAYLKSLPPAKPAKEIPLLNQLKGPF
jgi:mono/diheme cytochrome c family protein